MIDKVDFLHVEKHESLLQIGSMILMGMVKHSQSSKNSKFAMSIWNISKKKELEIKLIFLHADNYQSFPQVNFC